MIFPHYKSYKISDKRSISMFKFLSPGVSLWPIHHHRVLNFIESWYLNFTARLTYFLFTNIMTLKGTMKSFFLKLHNWPMENIGIYKSCDFVSIRKAID